MRARIGIGTNMMYIGTFGNNQPNANNIPNTAPDAPIVTTWFT